MKKIILLSAAVVVLAIGCTNSLGTDDKKVNTEMKLDTTKLKLGDVYYQCEMHPAVLSDKAGSCPECGMDLEKVLKK